MLFRSTPLAPYKVIRSSKIPFLSLTFLSTSPPLLGIIFVYFSLASVLWWLVLAFNLLLMVTKVQPASVKLDWVEYIKGLQEPRGYLRWETLFIAYHIFAWIPPSIPLIIALSAQRLGYGGHDIWYSTISFFWFVVHCLTF